MEEGSGGGTGKKLLEEQKEAPSHYGNHERCGESSGWGNMQGTAGVSLRKHSIAGGDGDQHQ